MKFVLLALFQLSLLIMFSQKSQNVELTSFSDGDYSVYKTVEKGYNKYVLELTKKKWPVQLYKEGEVYQKILIKRVGIIEENYEADLPTHPAYYHGASDIVITAIDKKMYYYVWSPKNGATIKYILSEKKPGSYSSEKETLDNYRKTIKEKQSGARDDRKEENAAIAAQEAEENSLKGKSIKSMKMKLVKPISDVGMLTIVAIGVEITLADGTILKTKNLGGKTPYADFETKVKGGDYAGGDFKVANDSRQIPNDKIEIEIWSKYDPSKKTSFNYPINYKNDIAYQYQGRSGNLGRGAVVGVSQNGGNGTDGKSIQVQANSQVVNGESVNHVVITDAFTGEIYAEAKVHVDNKITINVSGGNGGNGCEGRHAHSGNGGNGGDGGDSGSVTLIGDGASTIQLEVIRNGGRAGKGGAPENSNYNSRGLDGSNGSDGSFIK